MKKAKEFKKIAKAVKFSQIWSLWCAAKFNTPKSKPKSPLICYVLYEDNDGGNFS